MTRKSTWVAVAIALAVLALVIVLMASVWTGLGDIGISTAGWVALVFGVIVTLALGVGLMALIFISSRRGFDEPGGSGR